MPLPALRLQQPRCRRPYLPLIRRDRRRPSPTSFHLRRRGILVVGLCPRLLLRLHSRHLLRLRRCPRGLRQRSLSHALLRAWRCVHALPSPASRRPPRAHGQGRSRHTCASGACSRRRARAHCLRPARRAHRRCLSFCFSSSRPGRRSCSSEWPWRHPGPFRHVPSCSSLTGGKRSRSPASRSPSVRVWASSSHSWARDPQPYSGGSRRTGARSAFRRAGKSAGLLHRDGQSCRCSAAVGCDLHDRPHEHQPLARCSAPGENRRPERVRRR